MDPIHREDQMIVPNMHAPQGLSIVSESYQIMSSIKIQSKRFTGISLNTSLDHEQQIVVNLWK